MGILFIAALILAWPTFGLSVVAWFALMFFRARGRVAKVERRERMKAEIEPLFRGRFADFFLALDIPVYWVKVTIEEAHQCGRYIMSYIAHNPSETSLFIQGLQKWRTKGDPNLCDPVTAAEDEKRLDAKGEIHMVCYRAVEELMTNNKLTCFTKVDISGVSLRLTLLELKHID